MLDEQSRSFFVTPHADEQVTIGSVSRNGIHRWMGAGFPAIGL